MHLFVYEFVTGGGWYSVAPGELPPAGLMREGRAMLRALLADLAALPDATVTTLGDVRAPALAVAGCDVTPVASAAQERAALVASAARADWTIVVAPEFQGLLATRCRWVIEAGGRLLGAPVALVELTADKHRTAEYLGRNGIPTPAGRVIEPLADLPANCQYPAVVKPIDGAGSLGVRFLGGREDYPGGSVDRRRIERFCPGLPASISCLCGPQQPLFLPACEQILSPGGSFRYLGGRLPLAADLDQRAAGLAARVLNCLPDALGYLGIDLVLGPDPFGKDDYVIEVNPRLTTSYVGLRALAQGNLAAALLAVAEGRPAALSFGREAVQFAADGRLLEPAGTAPRDLR